MTTKPAKTKLKKPNVLAIADVHIYNYEKHSTKDSAGIPSRLQDFDVRLAHDLVKAGAARNCEIIVIAGDLLQSATVAPMVLNAAKRFIDTLAAGFKRVLIIPGQHDLDVKIDTGTVDHSVIAPIASNATYYSKPSFDTISIDGYEDLKIYAQPWTPSQTIKHKRADLFIGHGMVVGSVDPYGYTFTKGIDQESLFKHYACSVVGDIHQSQIFDDLAAKSRILVPGQPLQSNFSSGFPTGAWVLDFNARTTLIEFLPAHEFEHAKDYHYFLQQEGALGSQYTNVHYKGDKPAKAKTKGKSATTVVPQESLLSALERAIKEEPKFKNTELAIESLRRAYESMPKVVSRVKPKPSRINKLSISNFLSIGNTPLEMEFSNLREKNILITSDVNGAGKSTVFEAIYWLVTNSLTKDVPVAEISCSHTNSPARGELEFEVDGTNYRIVRTRKAGELVKLYREDADITSNNVQKQIYDLLGFSEQDIKMLMYFSLNEAQMFTHMGLTNQLNVVSELGGLEQLSELHSHYTESFVAPLQEKYLAANSEREYLTTRRVRLLEEKQALEVSRAQSAMIDAGDAREKVAKLKADLAVLVEAEPSLTARLAEQTAQYNAMVKQVAAQDALANKINKLTAQVKDLKNKRAALKGGACFACHQPLVNNDLLVSVTNDWKIANDRLTEAQTIKPEVSETQFLGAEADLDALRRELAQNREGQQRLNKSINDWQSHLLTAGVDVIVTKIETLVKEVEDIDTKLSANKSLSIAAALEDYSLVTKLLVSGSRNKVYLSLLSSAYANLCDKVNALLADVGHRYRVTTGKDYSLRVSDGPNNQYSVGRLSGGERRMLDIAMLLGLGQCYGEKYGASSVLGLRAYDEVLVYLSDANTQRVFNWIQDFDGVNLVATNDVKVRALFDTSIYVSIVDGISQYKFNF